MRLGEIVNWLRGLDLNQRPSGYEHYSINNSQYNVTDYNSNISVLARSVCAWLSVFVVL
jgi:hypothetical protein